MRNGNRLSAPVISEAGSDDLFVSGRHARGALIGDGKPEALGDFHFTLLGQAQERIHRVGWHGEVIFNAKLQTIAGLFVRVSGG